MKIQFLRNWLGHRRGAVLNVLDKAAEELIARRIAKPYEEKAAPGKKNVGKAR